MGARRGHHIERRAQQFIAAATADAASQQDSGVKIAIQAEIDFVR
jgi:hypothetical protein